MTTATMSATLLPAGRHALGYERPAAAVAPVVVWPERPAPDAELVRRIKATEGEVLESAPVLFKLVVAVGSGMLGIGVVGIVHQLAAVAGLGL